jgi:hypothetical protein
VNDGSLTDGDMAAANKDGTAVTPSLRTLGTGAQQAAAGDDPRFSDAASANLMGEGPGTGDEFNIATTTIATPTSGKLHVNGKDMRAAATRRSAGERGRFPRVRGRQVRRRFESHPLRLCPNWVRGPDRGPASETVG